MYPLRVGVTMSLHKLTAGSGYDYLTRQVAALDATEKGHTGLASYYIERGETPGVWLGSGMDGIDSLTSGDPVTAEQMRALFGCGLHPMAELRQQQLEGPDLTPRDFQDAVRLGFRSRSSAATSAHSARGRQAHRGDQRSGWSTGGLAGAGGGPGAGADRGRPRVLPGGARPRAGGCAGAGWADRQGLAPTDTDRRRL